MVAYGFALLLLALLSALAGAAWARSVCRRRWAEHLAHHALRDELTGLPNQQALLDTLNRLLSLADRLQRPVTVLMVEIDAFTPPTPPDPAEAQRHTVHTLTQRMAQRVRTHDILGRWDERRFFLVLPDTDVANALVLVEDLRQMCQDHPVNWQDTHWTVTVSIGVHGRMPTPTEPVHDLAADMVVAAQRALEATAADGPNRIEIEP